MTVEGFYHKCAELLGVPYDYKPFPYRKKTRWNNRAPGNGRFQGRGIIRLFGQTVHIALRSPAIHKTCGSWDEAITLLQLHKIQND